MVKTDHKTDLHVPICRMFGFDIDQIILRTYILAWEFVTRSCLEPQNPCSNHEIHVLFEHGFYLRKPKLGPDLHA